MEVTISGNDEVRQPLAEDIEDLAAFENRADEPNFIFEDVSRDLNRRSKISIVIRPVKR